MVPTLLALFAAAFITYLWSIRGFFSSFLHMLCILAAGAIAFGTWEPIAYWLLSVSPDSGIGSFVGDSAWGLALALPFAIYVLILRLSADKLIPQNAQAGTVPDYLGGSVCGLVAAIVSTGVMIISLQYLRMRHESWATYAAVDYTDQGTARGSLEKNKSMFRPWVDELTANLYGQLSLTTLRTSTPLAALQPDVQLVSSGMRLNYGTSKNGESRNTLSPDDFELIKSYTVGDTASGEPVGNNGITSDDQKPGIPQGFVDLDGNPVSRGYLAGYVINFRAAAKERSGQIVVGNGQEYLVVESNEGGEWKTLFPIAVISQADSSSNDLGRWRFDADNTFIASVGGASQAPFAFEFLVPTGYHPTYLYVKGVRNDVRAGVDEEYETVGQRDRAIDSRRIVEESSATAQPRSIDRAGSQTVATSGDDRDQGITVRNQIGRTIQRGNHGSLNIEESGRGWWIIDGEEVFTKADVSGRITEGSLRVDRLAVTEDTVVVKINVSDGKPGSLLGQAAATADATQPPIVVDSLGQRIQAVGFIYEDNERFRIRYTPGRPLGSINEVPALSSSRPNQQLELVFRCNFGTQLTSFMIGNKEIIRFDPPVELDSKQTR